MIGEEYISIRGSRLDTRIRNQYRIEDSGLRIWNLENTVGLAGPIELQYNPYMGVVKKQQPSHVSDENAASALCCRERTSGLRGGGGLSLYAVATGNGARNSQERARFRG
jgi:hypothetical protein